MKKLTKAELIERGKALGLDLTMKMTAVQMTEAIAGAVVSDVPEKEAEKPKELAVGSLVVTVNRVADCECSYIYPKTIAKILQNDKSGHKPLNVRFCNNGCTVWVEKHDVRALTADEELYAAARFSNANNYKYATVD